MKDNPTRQKRIVVFDHDDKTYNVLRLNSNNEYVYDTVYSTYDDYLRDRKGDETYYNKKDSKLRVHFLNEASDIYSRKNIIKRLNKKKVSEKTRQAAFNELNKAVKTITGQKELKELAEKKKIIPKEKKTKKQSFKKFQSVFMVNIAKYSRAFFNMAGADWKVVQGKIGNIKRDIKRLNLLATFTARNAETGNFQNYSINKILSKDDFSIFENYLNFKPFMEEQIFQQTEGKIQAGLYDIEIIVEKM